MFDTYTFTSCHVIAHICKTGDAFGALESLSLSLYIDMCTSVKT